MPVARITSPHFLVSSSIIFAEHLRRRALGIDALDAELVDHVLRLRRFVGGLVELGDDVRRRRDRRDKPYQLSASTSGRPCSANVFRSGSDGERLVEPMPDRLERAGLDMRQQHRNVGEHPLHLVAEQIVHGRRSAAIGNMLRLHARLELEQLGGQVRHAARARGGKVEVLRLAERQQLRDVRRLHVRRHDQDFGHPHGKADRLQILLHIVGHVGLHARIDRERAGRRKDRRCSRSAPPSRPHRHR